RLLILALMADRPGLIPGILKAFPEAKDPILLAKILRPYTDANLPAYEEDYLKGTSGYSGAPPGNPIWDALRSLGKIRVYQNRMLRDMVTARYMMVSIIADPHVYNPSSLTEIS